MAQASFLCGPVRISNDEIKGIENFKKMKLKNKYKKMQKFPAALVGNGMTHAQKKRNLLGKRKNSFLFQQ